MYIVCGVISYQNRLWGTISLCYSSPLCSLELFWIFMLIGFIVSFLVNCGVSSWFWIGGSLFLVISVYRDSCEIRLLCGFSCLMPVCVVSQSVFFLDVVLYSSCCRSLSIFLVTHVFSSMISTQTLLNLNALQYIPSWIGCLLIL